MFPHLQPQVRFFKAHSPSGHHGMGADAQALSAFSYKRRSHTSVHNGYLSITVAHHLRLVLRDGMLNFGVLRMMCSRDL